MVIGYCRISTRKQNIERQVRNILAVYPSAKIVKETFTGTQFQGRVELDKLLKNIKKDDTIVFDSVSRMSRTAEEGFALYEKLFNKGINLVFLKEPHINTETYKQAVDKQLQNQVDTGDIATNDLLNEIITSLNKYILALAKKQIYLAFEQAEKEVKDLQQRTKEGIETARRAGKQIGRKSDTKVVVKKAVIAKDAILKHNKTFGGSLPDNDTLKVAGVSRNSLYLYKRELKEEIEKSSFEEVVNKYAELESKLSKDNK